MTEQTSRTTRPARRKVGFHWTPRIIAMLVLLLLLLIFALQNLQVVSVSLIFVEMEMRLLWALLLFALIGAVIGLVTPRFWLRSRR